MCRYRAVNLQRNRNFSPSRNLHISLLNSFAFVKIKEFHGITLPKGMVLDWFVLVDPIGLLCMERLTWILA